MSEALGREVSRCEYANSAGNFVLRRGAVLASLFASAARRGEAPTARGRSLAPARDAHHDWLQGSEAKRRTASRPADRTLLAATRTRRPVNYHYKQFLGSPLSP